MFLKLVIVMVVVFFFYLWTATGGYYNFASGSGGGILYNELAKAFLKGQSDYKVTYQVRLPFPHFEFYLIIVPACLSLFIQFFLPMAAMRYYADFAVLFILACCIMWFHFDSKLFSYGRLLTRGVSAMLVIASILIGLALSIEGRFVGLKNQNPEEFEKLESFFKPLSNLIFKVTTKTLKDVK